MMKLSKIAFAGVASLSLVAAGAAQAASTRAAGTLPAPAKAKKAKLVRGAAPAEGASNMSPTAGIVLGLIGAGLTGLAIAEAVRDDNADSPGGGNN